ncbi:MAG: HPF/RaiA family ribosome-associated protein [Lachnospiraceae bacterium]
MVNVFMKSKTEALEQVVIDRVSKLEKYGIDQIDVTVKASKKVQSVEISLIYKSSTLRVEEYGKQGEKVYDILGSAISSMERKIRKTKTNIEKVRAEKIPEKLYEDEEELKEVVKVKEYSSKPMTLEEAMLQLEDVGHPFFLFENADTGVQEVLYKRVDTGYGIIRLTR